jgi:hypothetical protein
MERYSKRSLVHGVGDGLVRLRAWGYLGVL